MPFLDVGIDAALHYLYEAPADGGPTFVFVNSMGASTSVWEAEIGPRLRASGFGTLSMDYRGQGQTRYGEASTLLPDEIVGDLTALLAHVQPPRAVLVGLSIGGLFAMRAYLGGVEAEGMVLINSLRKQSAMVEWIIELEGRLLLLGGMPLVMDVFRPSLCSPKELARLRPNRLVPGPYTPWPESHPRHRLGSGVRHANWDVQYEELDLPVLVLSGLHDRFFRIEEDVAELTARMPDGRIVDFPDSGHALHEEDTDKFIAELEAFAAQLDGGRLPKTVQAEGLNA